MRKTLLLVLIIIIGASYLGWRANLAHKPEIAVPEDVLATTTAPYLSTFPEEVIQGEPVLVRMGGLSTTTIQSITFLNKPLSAFEHEGRTLALIGLDLKMTPGVYPIKAVLSDGTKMETDLVVGTRVIAKAPLGIPEELGGDTPEAEKELINTLVAEGIIINAIPTSKEKLWDGLFRFPLDGTPIITDTYGYSRLTGDSTISHKGTDFRAAVGTPVYAMNSGTVRFARHLRNYGNTIAIDHGSGILTIYMHLSEINTEVNKQVTKGELIGKSGATGYVLGPHLHLTIRINGISIDPMKFMDLFGS
ncbi:MAG: M23 family metallopeptidase [Parcubacteria group bacterium]